MRTLAVIGALALLNGCSGGSPSDKGYDASSGAASVDAGYTYYTYTSTEDGDTASTTSATGGIPAWWTLDGQVVVTYGVVDPAASLFRISLLDVDLDPLCTVEGPPVEVTDATPPQPDLLTWWSVVFPAGEECAIPTTGSLGIGAYDPLLDPSTALHDLPADTLNGLYVQSGADLWVMGVAGTTAQFDGTGATLDAAPLSDGPWKLQGLYLLPY